MYNIFSMVCQCIALSTGTLLTLVNIGDPGLQCLLRQNPSPEEEIPYTTMDHPDSTVYIFMVNYIDLQG